MTPIATYIKDFLAPRLRAHGLNKDQRATTCTDVEQRLTSVLIRWTDIPWRRTFLFLGEEEATFWEPRDADLDIRALVVMCVRNSAIEELHAQVRGRKQVITDEGIQQLTREAIEFFCSVSLDSPPLPMRPDVFGTLAKDFPNAWQSFSSLANADSDEVDYRMRKLDAKPVHGLLSSARMSGRAVVSSGMDPGLDAPLAAAIREVQKGAMEGLVIPSFARLTRNPVKLLSIVDHVLRHGGAFTTANYVFTDSFAARRQVLLRPPHDIDDVEANHGNTAGLTLRHKEYLGVE